MATSDSDIFPDTGTGSLLATYVGLHIAGGHVGMPVLVLLFLCSKHIQRPVTVINFCITWIIYSISYSLLIYAGPSRVRDPPHMLCLIQASMIHGAPPMAAVAGLEVVLQALSIFTYPWEDCSALRRVFRLPQRLLDALVILLPYFVFILFFLSTVLIGIRHPETIATRNGLHCTIVSRTLPFQKYAVPIFCAIIMSAIIVLEVTMITRYCRGWKVVGAVFPLAERKPSLSPWFRVTIFTLYSIATLGACITYLSPYVGPLPYMIQAALPLAATLVFGTQSDICYVCAKSFQCLRRNSGTDEQVMEYTPGGGWSRPTSVELSPRSGFEELGEGGRKVEETQTIVLTPMRASFTTWSQAVESGDVAEPSGPCCRVTPGGETSNN